MQISMLAFEQALRLPRTAMVNEPEPDPLIESNPDPEYARFLEDQLYEYNVQATGIADGQLLAVPLRGTDGAVVGGAYGWTWGGTCHVAAQRRNSPSTFPLIASAAASMPGST